MKNFFLFRFLSDLRLGVFLLGMLFLLTWFSTLEQVHFGLYETIQKYFSADQFFLFPKIGEKSIPLLLPNGYWVCLLLFLNLLVGGFYRLLGRKRKFGILITHFGVLWLLASGFVTYHFSQRAALSILEGETSSVAKAYISHTLEIKKIVGKEVISVHLIEGEKLRKNKGGIFFIPDLNLYFKLEEYVKNADVIPFKNSFTFIKRRGEYQAERNTPACVISLLNARGEVIRKALLSPRALYPFSIRKDQNVFSFSLEKKKWVLPFSIRLNHFKRELYPGTEKAKGFQSEITCFSGKEEISVLIQMNEPFKMKGITFFQASWGVDPRANKVFSVFEIVKNPADSWPQYALCMIGFGLFFQYFQRRKKMKL